MAAATASLVGVDGNPWGTRDLNAVGNNFVTSRAKLAFVAGDYAPGGLALDLSAVKPQVPTASDPVSVIFIPNGSYAAGDLSGIGGRYVYNPVTGKVTIWVAAGTEYATGALGADVTADDVIAEITWKKFL